MSIWIDNTLRRFNPAAVHTIDGVTYRGNILQFPDVVAKLGLREISEPNPPEDIRADVAANPDYYFVTESSAPPYKEWAIKNPEQIAQVVMSKAKVQRQAAVDSIVVTTTSGKAFDGDETSQGRMSRAINALDAEETTVWILADNVPAMVTREELREALRLAGAAQTAVWAAPYQP